MPATAAPARCCSTAEQVCACIVAVGQCDGRAVTTVEGLAGRAARSRTLQRGLRRPRRGAVRHLHPGHADARRVAAARESAADRGRRCSTRWPACSAAAPATPRSSRRCSPRPRAAARGRAAGRRGAVGRQPCRPARRAGQGARRRALRRRRLAGDPAGVLAMRVVRSPHPRARVHARRPRRVPRAAGPGVRRRAHRGRRAEQRLRASSPTCATSRCSPTASSRFRGEAVLALVGDAETLLALPEAELPITWQPRPAHETPDAALAAAAAGDALHARYPDNVLCRGRVVQRRRRGGARRPAALGAARERDVRDPLRRARLHRAGGGLGRGDRAAARRSARIRVFACTQTPYMDRDEIAHVLAIAPEQVHIVPSAIGGGFGGKLDISVQPLLAVAAWKLGRPVRLVYDAAGVDAVARTKRHPAQMTATATLRRRRHARRLRLQRRLQHRRLFVVGPDGRQPGADPRERPVPRAARARADPRRADEQQRRRRVPRLRRAAGGAARRGADRRARRAVRHRSRSSSAIATPCAPATARRPGSGSRRASACAQCLDALRPAWAAARARRPTRSMREASATGAPLRRGAGIACMWYGIGNTVIANPSTMRGALRCDAATARISSSTTARRRSARAPRRSCRRCSPTRSACRWPGATR